MPENAEDRRPFLQAEIVSIGWSDGVADYNPLQAILEEKMG